MDARNAFAPPLLLSCLAALLATGCADDGSDPPGAVGREARAAELFAPRETLDLVGTRWQVEAVVLPDFGKAPLVSGLVHTIELDAGGKRAVGHDGCGTVSRGYARDARTLAFDAPEPVGDAVPAIDPDTGDAAPPCEPSEIAAIERSLVEALLAGTERFEIRGDRLFLTGTDGAELVLRGASLGEIPAGVGPGIAPEFAVGEAVPFTVLEDSAGENLGAREVDVPERFVAVHDDASFATLWRNAHSSGLDADVPDFDFDVGSVVAVFSPLRPTLGHDIEVASIEASAGRGPEDGPLVRIVTTEPGAGCAVDQAMSVPYEIVGVPTVVAAPRFEETVVSGEPCT